QAALLVAVVTRRAVEEQRAPEVDRDGPDLHPITPLKFGRRFSRYALIPSRGSSVAYAAVNALTPSRTAVGRSRSRPRTISSFWIRIASGPAARIDAATSSAVARSWSAATTRFTRPQSSAVAAVIGAPVSNTSPPRGRDRPSAAAAPPG